MTEYRIAGLQAMSVCNGTLKLGRPQGKAEKLKLDVFKDEIQKYLDMGLSKAAIAKLIECPATTLYDYCRVRKMVRQK